MDILFSRISFLAFWLAYCLPQYLFTFSGSQNLKQLPLIVFHKAPWGKGFFTKSELPIRSNKERLTQEVFQGTISQIMIVIWDWDFEGPPILFFTLCWLLELLIFTRIMGCGFQGYCGAGWWGRWEKGKLKHYKELPWQSSM